MSKNADNSSSLAMIGIDTTENRRGVASGKPRPKLGEYQTEKKNVWVFLCLQTWDYLAIAYM